MKRIYNIMLLISILTLAMFASASTIKKASALSIPTFVVEPSKTIMGPSSAINQTFTVSLKLDNVTTANVPPGLAGVEVHLTWNNSLIEPVSFVSEVGLTGGVFDGMTVIYGINAGLYYDNGTKANAPPYTNTTHYEVAGASTSGTPWWGDDAKIAEITFKVIQQPQPVAICPLNIDFTDLADYNTNPVTAASQNATLVILTTSTTSETINFQGIGNYTITIASDSNITAPQNMNFQNYTNDGASFGFNVTTYDGFCNVTVPNNFMWSIPTDNWTVTVDGSSVTTPNLAITSDASNTYVWINFTSGTHSVMFTSTNVVPEFTATNLTLLLLASTLIVAATATSLRKRKPHY